MPTRNISNICELSQDNSWSRTVNTTDWGVIYTALSGSLPGVTFTCRVYPKITNVKFNGPATIVFFEDNTKIVVKCSKDDFYDPEKGILIAYMQKLLGLSRTQLRKWLDKMTKDATKEG